MSWGLSSGNAPEASLVRVRRGKALDVLIMVGNGMDEQVRTRHFGHSTAAMCLCRASGKSVGEAHAQGRGHLDLAQVCELLAVRGIERRGQLGLEMQRLVVSTSSMRPSARTPRAALAHLPRLASAVVAPQARPAGLDPR